MSKKNPLDPSEQFAKAIGGRKICRMCTPFERTRFMHIGSGEHPRCSDIECGCSCQDAARREARKN